MAVRVVSDAVTPPTVPGLRLSAVTPSPHTRLVPQVVIKPSPDRDEYVVWCTTTEAPAAAGTRAEVLTWLTEDWYRQHPLCHPLGAGAPAERLARADATGTSAMGGYAFGQWGEDLFRYSSRGYLRRGDLYSAALLLEAGRDGEAAALLERGAVAG